MRFLQLLRKYFFWIFDFLKGSPVRKHFYDVRNTIHNSNNNNLEKNLSKILIHTIQTTKFYNTLSLASQLEDFPVINKTIIRESFDSFLSDIFVLSELIPVVTSGSTGTPFKTYHDKNKKLRNSADTIFFASGAGFTVGDRLIYLKIFARQKMASPFHYWMQNIVPVDVIKLNDAQIAELIRQMEKSGSSFGFLGYSSALELVCQYLDKYHPEKVKTKVSSIITMSESLNEYTRITLEKYFNTKVVSRYSNLENGIIAQQETNGNPRFLVNTASYHIEILKFDTDNPAKEGELGRIVVTDLYNYAMPMIRYDTGDIGSLERDVSYPACLYLSKVEGRKLDMLYDTKGSIVSSYIMYKNMWQYTDIKQYQLIQEEEKAYRFKINADASFNREAQLVAEFKTYLGSDAHFIVEYVDEIPLLDSGKRRKLVNNYKPAL
jgi:phenylacetate-CoA ligase